MILCDTHDDPVIQINKNMMEMKYALLNEDWLETRIEKVYLIRLPFLEPYK